MYIMQNRNNIHHWSEPGNISAPSSANSIVCWAPPLLSMEKGKIKMINKILCHAWGGHLRVALGVVRGALRGEGACRLGPCRCGTGGWVVPVYELPSTWNLSSIALLYSRSKDIYPRIIWYGRTTHGGQPRDTLHESHTHEPVEAKELPLEATYLRWIGSWHLKIREKFGVLVMLWRFGSKKKWPRNEGTSYRSYGSNSLLLLLLLQRRREDMKDLARESQDWMINAVF